MNDVPSHVRQGPTFEHACTFVNVCVQRWFGGGACQQMSSCPHILARPRVLAASARRPSRAWRRARPAKTKTKPFRVALCAARTLKTPQGKRSSGYRRGKERFKSSLSATARGKGGCHRKQQILVIRNRPLAGGRFWLRSATSTVPE